MFISKRCYNLLQNISINLQAQHTALIFHKVNNNEINITIKVNIQSNI
jgi:hypothetical protein